MRQKGGVRDTRCVLRSWLRTLHAARHTHAQRDALQPRQRGQAGAGQKVHNAARRGGGSCQRLGAGCWAKASPARHAPSRGA